MDLVCQSGGVERHGGSARVRGYHDRVDIAKAVFHAHGAGATAKDMVRRSGRPAGRTGDWRIATGRARLMWFQPANSHTGQRHTSTPTGRTDHRNRLRARKPRFAARIWTGVHRCRSSPIRKSPGT